MKLSLRRRGPDHEITCREAMTMLAAYLDGALPKLDHDRLEKHLGDCENCGEYLKQLEVSRLVTGELRAEVLDPLAREDLIDLFRRWRDDPHGR